MLLTAHDVANEGYLLRLAMSGERLEASAALRPCEMYTDHGSARPSYTEGHHLHPVFLQNRVYGRILDPQLMWLCSTCHDNLHGELYWLLGERKRALIPVPRRARLLAEETHAWYVNAMKEKSSG